MDHIIEKLNTLSRDFRPIPFWSWNDHLEPEELKRQIHWMHRCGIGGFFMHARGGLKTQYLSAEWMDAVQVCCEEAQKLDMNAWVYDENGWPSGFVGGKLLEDPNNRDMYITHSFGPFDPAADVSYLLTENMLTRVDSPSENGNYLNLYLHLSASTVDILNPDVVKKFLEATHQQYKEHFGEALSQMVKGFFTDEPQYYRATTPYTPMVAEYFLKEFGMDILDQLGLLFVEKEGYRTFRYRYWLAMQNLMLENFSRQVYDWCCENGISFTGHYIEETSMGGQLLCCGGIMPFYEYQHIPGIDWLGSGSGNELPPRQLGSAARQMGKKQTLTETFACCGWNITPAELKRIAGFQYACGVNLMCHHLLPYSEHGQRKRDYPAHFNPINPWIEEHFKEFNDYFSGLGYLLSESNEPVNVAMLHPMRSAYFEYKRGYDAGAIPQSELDEPLSEACRSLSSRGIGYHFLDETLLEKHGYTKDGVIGCGQCEYTYLVIPRILTMGRHTEKLLRQFVQSGGKVLLLDKKPGYLEGEPYDYDYLHSNCSFAQIMDAQPFVMEDPDTEIFCTYRQFQGKPFLYVQNASSVKSQQQTFCFKENFRSFMALDPATNKTWRLPLSFTLEKNEGIVLFPDYELCPQEQEPNTIQLRFKDAAVDFGDNYLTLDTLRYSFDGISYSAPILCSDLFQKLLIQRYEGKIWLRYEFEFQTPPENIRLIREQDEESMPTLNGRPIAFDGCLAEEPCIQTADVTALIREGVNAYETVVNWHQSERTYHALFGEGVTESLRNCIAYDSEIEPIYLAGHFGVYSHRAFSSFDKKHLLGSSFYIGPPPRQVSEPVSDGLPFFRGSLTLSQKINLAEPKVFLDLPGDYLSAKVFVNEALAGEICFQDRLDISNFTKKGENQIRVLFNIGNRNLLGPHHFAGNEASVCPNHFETNDFPTDSDGATVYKFRCFY